METILSVQHINKIYGKEPNEFYALKDVSFEIKKGEFVAVMGPSGAGKSTLLNVLATIDQPTSGDIVMGNTSLSGMKESELADFRRDHLGFIFQDYNLLDSLTVRENILLPLAIKKTNPSLIKARVEEIAKMLGTDTLLDKYPYQISGGQKQRTAASRALITNPNIIFADEPTGALDSKSATDLLQSMANLNDAQGATIMMVTHDAYAASFCQRILFIKDGVLSKEIFKGNHTRKQFFELILQELSLVGGDTNDVI